MGPLLFGQKRKSDVRDKSVNVGQILSIRGEAKNWLYNQTSLLEKHANHRITRRASL